MLAIALAFTSIFRKIPRNERHSFLFALAIFLVASTGETLLTGASQDTGLFYLLVLLTLTRGEPSRKALP
jgi:hypothetical protein